MKTVFEKFNDQFTEFDFIVETEEVKVKYIFDKEHLTGEQADILAETFNTLYDNEVYGDNFDSFLDKMGIDYYNMGTVGFEE